MRGFVFVVVVVVARNTLKVHGYVDGLLSDLALPFLFEGFRSSFFLLSQTMNGTPWPLLLPLVSLHFTRDFHISGDSVGAAPTETERLNHY